MRSLLLRGNNYYWGIVRQFAINSKSKSTKNCLPPRNEEIRVPIVMLIKEDNQQAGPFALSDLLAKMNRNKQDLLLVNSTHSPPLVKFVDKSAEYRRQQALDDAAALHRYRMRLKEIRFKVTMAPHDLETRWKQLREKLEDAYRIRILVTEGGMLEREHLGKKLIERLKNEVGAQSLLTIEPPSSQAGKYFATFHLPSAKPPIERQRNQAKVKVPSTIPNNDFNAVED